MFINCQNRISSPQNKLIQQATRIVRLIGLTFTAIVVLAGFHAAHADVMKDIQDCATPQNRSSADQQYCNAISAYRAKNYNEAIADLKSAQAAGNNKAPGFLGYMYEKGKGVPADPNRAFIYYKQGAELGNGDAMNEVARCYQYGIGVPVNMAESDRWLQQSKSHGTDLGPQEHIDRRAKPDMADLNAGTKLYDASNFAGALPVLLRAAQAGNDEAQLKVGYMYEYGQSIAKNKEEAVRWYTKSATWGNAAAQHNLGNMYEDGEAGENWILAAQFFQKSAEQGFRDGEFSLGRCYEFGIGVPQNRQEAIRWFSYAGRRGDSKAAYFAKWLAEPTNFIGFRNDTESKYVMDRIRYAGDFLGGDPNGVTFHNSAERDNFLIAFKTSANFHEAQAQWGVQHNNYTACMGAGGGSSCHNPGPPPAIPVSH